MNDDQWIQFTDADDRPREEAAFGLLRERLPGWEPFRAWANFKFWSLDGAFFDVHLLVFSPAGVFLVECATQRGRLDIGSDLWLHTKQNGEVESLNSPLTIAAHKAKELRTLLEQMAPGPSFHAPRIQPVVFLTERDVEVEIDGDAKGGLFFHPDRDEEGRPSILDALVEGEGPGVSTLSKPLDAKVLERFEGLVDEADFVRTTKYRRLGDFELGELLDTTEYYQDYVAEHVSTGERRRARVFRVPRGASDETLARIQEAARRDHDLLAELDHESILTVLGHIGDETRPTVFFEHPDNAVRLDHYLAREKRVGPTTRYAILEAVTEAVRFAHEHRVIHRALNPCSVLIVPGQDRDEPGVRLLNWHTGRRDEYETGTQHITDYLHEHSKLFLAPELSSSPHVDETADVFGLGALAFFLFTNRPPAPDLQSYVRTLMDRGGLRPGAVTDNVAPALDEIVYDATRVSPDDRIGSAGAFLDRVEKARDQITAADVPPQDPLDARAGDPVGPYTIKRRIGSGSTATALLAEDPEGHEVVLKVANDERHASRLDAEARALSNLNKQDQLDNELVVDLYDRTTLGGRRTLVLEYAGDTLFDELRERSALSLDDQRRFGEDLCRILVVLEEAGVFHRDIKPSNLGIGRPGNRGPKRLMLFDFSINDVGVDALDVGTRAYRDPFLAGRRVWDVYADRYSAGLVLYEMVTRRLPEWGDGRTNPAFSADVELHLDVERFPAAVRDGLEEFFRRALAREHSDRFDTAEEMLKSWRGIYSGTVTSDHGTETKLALEKATPSDELHKLGLSEAARDALDALGVSTAKGLIKTPTNDIHFLTGTGREVREELLELRGQLVELFPGLAQGAQHVETSSADDYRRSPVDEVVRLIRRKPADLDIKMSFAELIDAILPDNPARAFAWMRPEDLARGLEMGEEDFESIFLHLRSAWLRKRVLDPLRDDVVRIIDEAGGAMEAGELARAVLGERGAHEQQDDARLTAAAAASRAAVEAELAADGPRVQLLRLGSNAGSKLTRTFVTTRPELRDVLPDLGEKAGELAALDTLASSARALRELAAIMEEAGIQPLPRHRLLALAAAASEHAAVSRQDEIYPANMDPVRALRLTSNLLLRRAPLSDDDVARAVRDRYPEVGEIPSHPELNDSHRSRRCRADSGTRSSTTPAACTTRATAATSPLWQ